MADPTIVDDSTPMNPGGPLFPTGNKTVDFSTVSFQGTLQNPFFWIMVGVVASVAVQYLFVRHSRK